MKRCRFFQASAAVPDPARLFTAGAEGSELPKPAAAQKQFREAVRELKDAAERMLRRDRQAAMAEYRRIDRIQCQLETLRRRQAILETALRRTAEIQVLIGELMAAEKGTD